MTPINAKERRHQRRQVMRANARKAGSKECLFGAPVVITAVAGQPTRPPRIAITAYNGGELLVDGFDYPVVVDLLGLTFPPTIPLNVDHEQDIDSVVGQGVPVLTAGALLISGTITGNNRKAAEVLRLHATGFKWQASIKTIIYASTRVPAGVSVLINGRQFVGPLIHATESQLTHCAVLAEGADQTSTVTIAARPAKTLKGNSMTLEQWLAAMGIDPATLTPKGLAAMQAAYAVANPAPVATAAAPVVPPAVATPPAPVAAAASSAETAAAVLTAQRKADATEVRRVAELRAKAAGHDGILAKAIEEGWDVHQTELAVLKASRPTGPNNIRPSDDNMPRILEAAAAQTCKLPGIEKLYTDKELQAAHTAYKGRIGLQEMIVTAAAQNGWTGRNFKNDMLQCLKAAFSTVSLPGILSNVANNFLLAGYGSVEDTWKKICATRSVTDFKTVTSYRMTGNSLFEKVGPGGEIKHGSLGEQSYTNQAETYAKMYVITRQMLINDDMDALSQIPKIIGRGSALKVNEVFWTEFMDNASLFAATHTVAGDTGNSNLSTGAGSAMGIAGLTAAELLFYNQVDPDGNPIGVDPKYLLVPNAQFVPANQFMNATEVRDTTANTKYATNNPHTGKWEIIRSSYLSNTSIPGYSTTAWYMLANPSDVAVIEGVFLNGNQTPIIENADADFNTLGIQMRGYFDFGFNKQDFRGGVKSDGA